MSGGAAHAVKVACAALFPIAGIGDDEKAEVRKDETVAVQRSSFNVGGVIAAIALLLLVLGLLKYFGVSPL